MDGYDNSDTALLINWLSEQVLTLNVPEKQEFPKEITALIRKIKQGHIYLPVFQRLLYSKYKDIHLSFKSDILGFFKWIEASSSHMDTLYIIFKFNDLDIILLKRSEFCIYQGYTKKIWKDILNFFIIEENHEGLHFVSKVLMKVNLYSELDELMFQVSKTKITKHLDKIYWDDPIYGTLVKWVELDVFMVFDSYVSMKNVMAFREGLFLIAKNLLIKRRIKDLYHLISKYPFTIETMKEINRCLDKSTYHDKLVQSSIQQLNQNLLLPSVKTVDIIIYYIKTIHSFLLIDHRGVLLDKVARPIRNYLRTRDDTIEKIVNGLLTTDRKKNKLIELNSELVRGYSKNSNSKSRNYKKRTLKWQPDPVDALPDFQIGKIDDIIDSLTSIFDDNSLFIDQFVKIFSVDLLTVKNYDISHILNSLSLLKTKFVDDDFNILDIMINDIQKSKLLDTEIHDVVNTVNDIHGVFLSYIFWPNLSPKVSAFVYPKVIKDDLEKYEKGYEQFQKDRVLTLHPEQTLVDINIEIGGVNKPFRVTLEKLLVLNFINDSSIKDIKMGIIMMNLKMPLVMVKSSLEFWAKEDILIESHGGWRLNE